MKSRIMPPTYLWIFILLAIILHFIIPLKKLIFGSFRYIGIVLILFGVIVTVWADQLFKQRKTTVKPYKEPSAFEVKGPFRISRHPMYLGMASVLLGEAIILGSLVSFVFPVTFVLILEACFIPYEERNMEKRFGRKYVEYKRKARRWI